MIWRIIVVELNKFYILQEIKIFVKFKKKNLDENLNESIKANKFKNIFINLILN